GRPASAAARASPWSSVLPTCPVEPERPMTESTHPRPTRIVLVDDHPLMRKGMVQLLALEPDFEVVGEAASGAAALPLCREVAPDLVLLDLNMAGMNGIETLRQLRDAGCRALAVVYTVSDNAE